jgi:glycosyltransferase involved in cell wall biosynthesis
MKILYFSFVELDIPNACQTHTLGVLKGLSDQGASIDAVLPRSIRVKPEIPGVRFLYIWPWRFSSLGISWIKLVSAFYFFLLCSVKRYDAIYVREIELNPFPRWCSRLFRIPHFIEVNAIRLHEEYIESGRARRIEKTRTADFRSATGLITPSFQMSRWIATHYHVTEDRIHTIPNGFLPPEKETISRAESLSRLGLPENGFYLGYMGNIWAAYDLDGLLEAVDICRKDIPNLRLLIIGGGPGMEGMREKGLRMGLKDNLIFAGYVQPENLFQVMGAIDIGSIYMTEKGLQDSGPITTRFATYAGFGVPVICNDYQMEDYPAELIQGLSLVPHSSPRLLAQAITSLYLHPEVRKEKAHALKRYVFSHMTWQRVAEEIMTLIKKDGHKKG